MYKKKDKIQNKAHLYNNHFTCSCQHPYWSFHHRYPCLPIGFHPHYQCHFFHFHETRQNLHRIHQTHHRYRNQSHHQHQDILSDLLKIWYVIDQLIINTVECIPYHLRIVQILQYIHLLRPSISLKSLVSPFQFVPLILLSLQIIVCSLLFPVYFFLFQPQLFLGAFSQERLI